MGQVLHGSARTTEATRRAIQHSQESLNALATRYGINEKTVAKWRKRGFAQDVPMGPKKPASTVMTPEEEAVCVAFRRPTLLPIIREQVPPDSIVYTDRGTAYDVLDVSEFHHRRVNHSKVFVTQRGHHINGSENFWNQAKRHLRRFNGLTPENFDWFLKECEWRFNGGNHQQLLQQLKCWYKATRH